MSSGAGIVGSVCRDNIAGKCAARASFIVVAVAGLAAWAWPGEASAESRPYLYGCGITWGEWLGMTGETAREFDRRSMDKIVEMGGTNCPANFAWIGIEPTRGTYNWDVVDHQVAEATARGLEVFSYTGLTPDWALPPGILDQYGSGIGYRFPPDEQYIPDFEAFFTALAARYRGQVKYYEFWNEPNGCSWINDGCSNGHMAYTYVPWLIRWYNAMKAGDPDCVLAVGGLDYNEGVTQGYQYIEDIYANGGGDYFDAVAIHPYGNPLHWQAIHDTYQVLVNHGDGHKKLWLNEWGWNTSDENLKAANVTTVLNTLKQPEYDMVFQANYLIITDLPGTPDWGHDYGLCSRNTSTLTITPRQSWYAFRDVDKSWPETVDFSADVTAGTSPLTVQFTDESDISPAIAWEWDFGDGTFSTEQNPAHAYTQEGWFTVRLTVTGVSGPEALEKTDYIRVGTFPKVAFIGGQVPPTLSDSQVVSHLESRGLQVDVYDDEPANRPTASQIAATHDLVIGSSTLLSVNVAGEFRYESVPFIYWESALSWCGNPDDRECIANGATALPGQTQLNILDNSHPVTAGLPTGNLVLSGSDSFSYCTGAVAPGAQVLATATGDAGTKTLIVVEPGAELLDGGTAAGKRVFLHYYDTTWQSSNATGRTILDNSLGWCLGTVTPDFTGAPTVGLGPLPVTFTDTSTGPVTGWTWSFGDGASSKLRHPVHTYSGPGVYTVRLTTTGPGGTTLTTKVGYVTVIESVAVDFDGDNDVDLADFGTFQNCLSGPGVPMLPGCEAADLDEDYDVDRDDFGAFQLCLSGSGVPPDPACIN
jgi:PKD repeat protein